MRELLLLFILAVIIGSIINGWPKEKPSVGKSNPSSTSTVNEVHRDFPDFNTFPNINSTNFNDLVISSPKPVFIVCYADNNLFCERMIPLIAAFAQEHKDSINITRLNVADNAALATNYGIRTLPGFLIFNQGKLAAALTGVVPKERLEEMIKPYLTPHLQGSVE